MMTHVRVEAMCQTLANQRNSGLDMVAQLQGEIADLQTELTNLRADNEKLKAENEALTAATEPKETPHE